MNYEIPQNAKITGISETTESIHNKTMTGLLIETDKGNIKLLISTDQECCESWGAEFLETPDDTRKYIGATLVSLSDTNESELPESDDEDEQWDGEIKNETQLKITTNRGVLQYAVYNEHNGYYSHATFLQVFDVIEESSL